MENTIATKPQVSSGLERLEKLFEIQRAAFKKDPYPSADERIELMRRVPGMLKKYRAQILQALDDDFCGHSPVQGDLLEIVGMFDRAKYNIDNVKKWMKPLSKSGNPITLGSSKVYLKYYPKGVVGNMVSWNFPFDIAIGPMLDQLAAGNRVIIKPSDLAPACGKVLQTMIEDTFDEDRVAVVNGGLDLAKQFPTLPWNHLVYTGSGKIGKDVMKKAANNLVPVTLELGGKSPVIVDKDSINEVTISEIAGVKSVKRGQMCVTADYCFVHESQMDTFTKQMIDHYTEHFTEDNGAAHCCGIISQRHVDRLEGLLEEAREAGVRVVQIGEDIKAGTRDMPFYIVVDPPNNIGLMQEEIFGPILPIKPYKDVEEVLSYVNEGDSPLGLYIYSKDQQFIDTIIDNTQSGGVSVNLMAFQAAQPSLPFGGVGASGMGVHHGEEGFKEFSNPRGHFIKGNGGTFSTITPPYGQDTEHLINEVAYASIGKQLKFALKTLPKNIMARVFKS